MAAAYTPAMEKPAAWFLISSPKEKAMEDHSLHGRDLLFSILRHEKTQSAAWVPFAGVHAGRLKGYSAVQVLTDADKLLSSLLEVHQLYHPDGQPVIFDLQVEAEILGCPLFWSEKSPPSVAAHPLENTLDMPVHLPEPDEGRLPLILKVMQAMKAGVGSNTALYGLVTGPFTLASHLRGTEIFMDMIDRPQYTQDLLAYCTQVCLRISSLYIEAGMDVIALVDPLVSQISPRHFLRYLTAPFKEIFSKIRSDGIFSAFFVCGDATRNIEVMCQTSPDALAVDENIDLFSARTITEKYQIALQGNIPLTSCMLLGSQQDNMKFVVDLLAKLANPGQIYPDHFILSPGCDMPYDVPPDNVIGILQALREPVSTRAMLANYQSRSLDLEKVALPDYTHLKKPLVEVFTLDSSTCPACGYMLLAAKRAVNELNGQVELVEYKITQAENIARMQKLGVRNLPSILVNGQLKFSSIIPGNRELMEEIRKFIH
jgi:uroporphyrinogen decarboxylase